MNMTYEALKALVAQSRSYRRFDGTRAVTGEEMEQMIELCRLSPSGANHQTLRFRPVIDEEVHAASLKDVSRRKCRVLVADGLCPRAADVERR